MGSEADRFGVALRRKKGVPYTMEDYCSVLIIMAETICLESKSKMSDENKKLVMREGIDGIREFESCSEFEDLSSGDTIKIEYGDDIYGDLGGMYDNLISRIKAEFPELSAEVVWVDFYGGKATSGWFYDSENPGNVCEMDDAENKNSGYSEDDFDEDEDFSITIEYSLL